MFIISMMYIMTAFLVNKKIIGLRPMLGNTYYHIMLLQKLNYKEYLKFVNRLYLHNLIWTSLLSVNCPNLGYIV